MEAISIREVYNSEFKEYILGSHTVRTHGVYLVYGEAAAGERREMGSRGHEELLLLLVGTATVEEAGDKILLTAEHAVYLGPETAATLIAETDCRYVVAGGHAREHSH